mgnify:CR=1 FL=1
MILLKRLAGLLKRGIPSKISSDKNLTGIHIRGILITVQNPKDPNMVYKHTCRTWEDMYAFFNLSPYNWRVIEIRKL